MHELLFCQGVRVKNGFAMVPDSGIVAGLFVLGFEL